MYLPRNSVRCQTHTSCVGLKTTTFSCSTFHFCPSWCFSPMGPFAFNINDDTEQGQPTSSRPSQVTHLSLNLLRAINYNWLPDDWNQYDIGTQTGLINIIIRLPSPSAGFDLYFFILDTNLSYISNIKRDLAKLCFQLRPIISDEGDILRVIISKVGGKLWRWESANIFGKSL